MLRLRPACLAVALVTGVAGSLVTISIGVGSAHATTAAPQWTLAHPKQLPPFTFQSVLAYDAAAGQLLMVGQSECTPNATWTWDGANWWAHELPVEPEARSWPTVGYDDATKQLVLFGGFSSFCDTATEPTELAESGELGDTWTWNGSVWAEQHPATSPQHADQGCAAYDAASQQFIMFGGKAVIKDQDVEADQTWQWSGSNWAQLNPAATPPGGACAMTYDLARKVIVLVTDNVAAGAQETWTWDGTNWTNRGVVPFLGFNSNVAFDPDTGDDVVYVGETEPCTQAGHFSYCTQRDQTWSWDGSGWSQAPAHDDPQPGGGYVTSYDPATHQLVMFGGYVMGDGTTNTGFFFSSPATSSVSPTRIAGANRQATAVAVSQSAFPTNGSASAVVLARADVFADALAGGPLAAAKHAPLLLTSSGALDPLTKAEIQRVLAPGGAVYLLGGSGALSDAVAAAITALGDLPTRVAGADRFATAAAIAAELGNPTTVFEASGTDYPDALSAVPAAVAAKGAILLTNGSKQASATATYLSDHTTTRYAIGGPAAYADPTAIGIAGADRYQTSDAVALAFFPDATGISVASGASFPDALAGGPVVGADGQPMLLVPPAGSLPEPDTSYLMTHAATIDSVRAFGGPSALSAGILAHVAESLRTAG